MKTKILLALAFLFLFAGLVRAQDTNTANGILAGGSNATNWVAIPYLAYDLTTKKIGGGGALLYSVTDYFWAGVRAQSINGQSTTAGVQGQLQVSKQILGVTVMPFGETSLGLGNSALYGNAGAGALINFHTWAVGKTGTLTLGLIGDYEHYVYGTRNGDQVNAGLAVRASF